MHARALNRALLMMLLPLLGACAPHRASRPLELLDESSGALLTIVRRPIICARSRTDVAANARDYVTLAAAQEDRSGRISDWLIVHRWSTVDPRFSGDAGVGSGRLRIVADDRVLTLAPAVPAPSLLARRRELFAPPNGRGLSLAYAVDRSTLRYLASAHSLSLRFTDDALPLDYTVWDDGRPALQAWLSDTGPP